MIERSREPIRSAAAFPEQKPLAIDWNAETKIYDRAHARLAQAARLLSALPGRKLLDVGCSSGRLRDLLPPDFEYYGCDIADLAATRLPADRFRLVDFNRSTDLSFWRHVGFDAIHIGGVLEYLTDPMGLLVNLRATAAAHCQMVVSMIQFEAPRYTCPSKHHAGWIYKPTRRDFETHLARSGWSIEDCHPVDRRRPTSWLARLLSQLAIHPYHAAEQLVYVCESRPRQSGASVNA